MLKEKTKTHPSDPICWEAMPTEPCSLEFRPPSASELEMTTTQCLWQWTIVCVVSGIVFWLLKFVALSSIESLLFRGFIVVAACFGVHAIAMNVDSELRGAHGRSRHNHAWSVGLIAVAVLLMAPFPSVGLVLFGVVGTGLVVYLAREVVRHGVGWHTANPEVEGDTRAAWRAGAESVMLARGSQSRDVRLLGNEAAVAVMVVAVGFMLAPLCHGLCWQLGKPTLSWWVPPLIVGTLFLFQVVWLPHSRTSPIVAAAIGHWHDYQRASASSPMTFQSPAGASVDRTMLTWLVLSVNTLALAASISNLRPEFLVGDNPSVDPQFVSAIDIAIVSLATPWIVWFALRILAAPTLIAALIRHEEEVGKKWEVAA